MNLVSPEQSQIAAQETTVREESDVSFKIISMGWEIQHNLLNFEMNLLLCPEWSDSSAVTGFW